MLNVGSVVNVVKNLPSNGLVHGSRYWGYVPHCEYRIIDKRGLFITLAPLSQGESSHDYWKGESYYVDYYPLERAIA